MATEYKKSSGLGSIMSVKGYSGYVSYNIVANPSGGYSDITIGVGAYSASDGNEYSSPVYFTGTISVDGTVIFNSSSFAGTSSLNFGSGGYQPLRTDGSAWSHTYRLTHTYSTTSTIAVSGKLYNDKYGNLSYSYSISFTVPSLNVSVSSVNNPLYVKVSDAWKKSKDSYVKVSGAWKKAKEVYVKYNGVWIVSKNVVAVKLQGAPSESITLKKGSTTIASGLATSTSGLTTDTLALEPGTYTATGSVSGYTATLNITAAGTYNVYPAGALYWYGLEVVPFTVGLNQGYSSAGAWKRTNYIDLYGWSNSNGATGSIAQARTTNTIDTSKYSKINYRINVTTIYEKYSQGTAQIRYGHKTSTAYGTLPGSTLTSGNSTYSITSPGTSTYLAVSAYTTWGGYSGNYQARCYVYAIWGE